MEDCADYLNFKSVQFDYVLMIDRYNRHAEKYVDILNTANMDIDYGGTQSRKKYSVIYNLDDTVGSYHNPDNCNNIHMGGVQ